MTIPDLDWNNLGFEYRDLPFRYISKWKDGKWDAGTLTEDSTLHVSEASAALHYGQQGFEGLKAYRTKDGSVQLFRPDKNAERLQKTADRLIMPHVETEQFVEACRQVVAANIDWVPPYGSGATLYLRPLLIGVGSVIGVRPAPEYIFTIFAMPVGPYYKGGLKPNNYITAEFDRAAPHGTGANKVGGNYAASILPGQLAHDAGFADCVYLDPATHTKIEEIGGANFFGITADNQFITPLSPSILPSITKYSLLHIAGERFGMETIEGDVPLDGLDKFVEAGACGTAAVISPIGGIQIGDNFHKFYSTEEVGPVTTKLYNELVGIQFGDIEAPEGWIVKV
ncbi:MAG: branched-chain amino acid aminotransferase [Lactobacillales bacterium]|jgi:branched-chain amino acid aminotransferase|nr:branched-chain amino acid aminotransferase [Lactobacillales bacterium]